MRTIERNVESKLKQKSPTPANRDNGIKTDVAVVVYYATKNIRNMLKQQQQGPFPKTNDITKMKTIAL